MSETNEREVLARHDDPMGDERALRQIADRARARAEAATAQGDQNAAFDAQNEMTVLLDISDRMIAKCGAPFVCERCGHRAGTETYALLHAQGHTRAELALRGFDPDRIDSEFTAAIEKAPKCPNCHHLWHYTHCDEAGCRCFRRDTR